MNNDYILCNTHGIQTLVYLDIAPNDNLMLLLEGTNVKKYKDAVLYIDTKEEEEEDDIVALETYRICEKCLMDLAETFNRSLNGTEQS